MKVNEIYLGDSIELSQGLPEESIDTIITSPPYYKKRDYKTNYQIGSEDTPDQYIDTIVNLFSILKSKLKKTGSLFLNIGDSYGENRSLLNIPERIKIRLTDYGFICRNTIIWIKPNPFPESCKNRFTNDFEYIYFFTLDPNEYYFKQILTPFKEATLKRGTYPHKSHKFKQFSVERKEKYYNNLERIGGVNLRSSWIIANSCSEGLHNNSHPAIFPRELVRRIIRSATPPGGLVLDPFIGSGTVAIIATQYNCQWIGFEINNSYREEALLRIERETGGLL